MPLGQALAMAFMGLAFLATWRSSPDRTWLGVGFVVLAGTMIAAVRDGIREVVLGGPISGSFIVASLLIGSLLWANVLGLPSRLALLTGVGLSREQWKRAPAELRRRFGVAWLATFGIALLVVGVGQLSGYGLPPPGGPEPGFLLAACELGLGVTMLIGGVIVATKR
jgi:hypothetical protein